MSRLLMNDTFWKKQRNHEEWQLLLDSNNHVTLLVSYFIRDSRFNSGFSQFLCENQNALFYKFAFLYIKSNYYRHVNWIRESNVDSIFKERIEEVWSLQEKKVVLFDKWTQELFKLEFDVVLYYFSGYFGANVNSRALWHGANGLDVLFILFMREAYSHFISAKSKTGDVKFKWKTGETPRWSLNEHGASSMRFQSSSESDPLMSHFRETISGIFKEYAIIESKLIVLINEENSPDIVGKGEEIASKYSEGNFRDWKRELSWYTLLHNCIEIKDLEAMDLHWLLNSIRNKRDLIPAGVLATLFLQCAPHKIRANEKNEIDLVKWGVALSEFVKFQLPAPFPEMGIFQHDLENRRMAFEKRNPIDGLKSIHITPNEQIFQFFHDLYGFSIEQIDYVFGALTFKMGSQEKFEFHLYPFIETAEGEIIISLTILSKISWPNQLIVSLSGIDKDAVRQEIAYYREKLVYSFLDKLNFQNHHDLKLLIDGKVNGNIDALTITDNVVYFFEVKGIDKFSGYYDLEQRVLEKMESEAADQLMKSISSRNKANVTFTDSNKIGIDIPSQLIHKAIILSNNIALEGRSHSGMIKSSIIELGILCSTKLQDSFLEILGFYYPDKSVIPFYQNMFDNIRASPALALKILEEGTFWNEITSDLAR